MWLISANGDQPSSLSLGESDLSRAIFIFNTITVKRGKRKGDLYQSSRSEWRNPDDKQMKGIHYVWRTLAFRLGQDVQIPIFSDRYLLEETEEVKKGLEKIVDYIGFTYFDKEYSKYKGERH